MISFDELLGFAKNFDNTGVKREAPDRRAGGTFLHGVSQRLARALASATVRMRSIWFSMTACMALTWPRPERSCVFSLSCSCLLNVLGFMEASEAVVGVWK